MGPTRAFLVHACVFQVVALGFLHPARRQLIKAAGPPSHSIDGGSWEIVPNLEDITALEHSRAHSGDPDMLTGMEIEDAIKLLKSVYSQVCMTVEDASMGGLANTMGLVNTAMDLALQYNVSWVMPGINPPAHKTFDSFTHMFGKEESCGERDVAYVKASCPAEEVSMVGRHGQAIPEDERVHYSDGVSCWASKTVVDGPFTGRSSVCGCDALVVQGQSAWHFDYSRTGPMLSAKYWAEQANRNNAHFPPDFPMATVMHIRLGDVEFHPGPGKFVDGQTLATMVGAFVSASKMNPSCLNVTLVTDGKRDNEHVLAVQAAWSDSGVQSIHVSDIDEPVDKAFDDMTHASILLGGPSGFPRLAAVLGRAQVKVFLNGKDESHPIWYLDGATELPLESGRTEMQDHIMSNSALMNAAFACEEWLRR